MAYVTLTTLTATSTPADAQQNINLLLNEFNGGIATGDLAADFRIQLGQLAQSRFPFIMSFARDVATGKTFDNDDTINFEIPEGVPPINIYAMTLCSITANTGGQVRLYKVDSLDSAARALSDRDWETQS